MTPNIQSADVAVKASQLEADEVENLVILDFPRSIKMAKSSTVNPFEL